jgi:photosystem II stability/assembly factor-like uncharacterized protein
MGGSLVLAAATMSLAACGTTKVSVSTGASSRPAATIVPGRTTEPPTPTTAEESGEDQPGRLLQFVSPSTGWLVDQRTGAQILGTTDGGRTWWTSYQRRAALSQTDVGEILSIDFASSSHGWALLLGQGLMATQDGGRTWSAPTEPGQGAIATFTFTGADQGWAVTYQGTLLRTLDGGQTWRTVPTPVSAVTVCATAEGDLWFGSGGGNVYSSIDGALWNVSLSGTGVPDIHNAVGPRDQVPAPWLTCAADTAWAFYDYGESAGSQPNALEHTLDGGRSWVLVSASEVAPGATALPSNNLDVPKVIDLGATGASSAWFLGWCGACGGRPDLGMTGTASITTSNASTFSNSPISTAGVGAIPVDASFSDPDHGCVVVEELSSSSATKLVVLITSDGGTTWSVVNPNVNA